MFGRRKPKSPAEEDLLVPHGLIWQATDEPQEPGESDSTLLKSSDEAVRALSPHEERPAISVVPAARVSNTQQPALKPADASPTRLGAISPPIPWPSPKTASVIRRTPPPTTSPILPGTTVPSLTELQKQPQPVLHDAPATQQRARVEVVDLTTTARAGESSRGREIMTQVLQSLGQRVGSIRNAIASFLGQVRGTAHDAYQSINLRSRIQGLKLAKEKCVATLSSRSRLAGQSLQRWWRSSLSGMGRMKSIRNYKLHIRIVKPVRAHELIKRSRLAWAEREDAIRREPRLWMSLMMAALSAMLTMGVISAVSHYAPGADASNKAATNPSEHNSGVINPKIVVGPRTSGTSAQASGATRSVASPHAKPASAQENSTQTTTTRRPHRNSNQDSVAPDTYHYYGMDGKSR